MMKRLKKYLLILCACTTHVGFGQNSELEKKAALELQYDIIVSLDNFIAKLAYLEELVVKNQPGPEMESRFLSCRLAYKEFEFIVGYQDNHVLRELNGVNQVVNVNNFSYAENKEPHGLQVIEDFVYNYDPAASQQLIDEVQRTKDLATELKERFERTDETSHSWHVIIWDAMRFELIRLETMGITGFDTPICKNAIPEAEVVIRKMAQVLFIYKDLFRANKLNAEYKTGEQLLQKTLGMLRCETCNADGFNAFDRMAFITEGIHPIYKWMKQSVQALEFRFPTNIKAININAENIYDKTALNDQYFNTGSTDLRIALGERLFHDTKLSGNNERSCASCHIREKGMADGLQNNFAFSGADLPRHTPTLWNAIYQSSQFWDSRVTTLEKQALSVINNHDEMNGNLEKFKTYVSSDEEYVRLFDSAYTGYITIHNIVHAINCFVGSLKSFDSRFDQYMRGDKNALDEQEIRGFNLFTGKAQCATCHFPPLFNGLVPPFYTESEAEIIGVPVSLEQMDIIDPDSGKFLATKLDIHRFAFKIPGVRNIELTAPYMHNGIFKDLDQLMDFYNKGGGLGHGITGIEQTLPESPLNLSNEEVSAVIAFMKSLTSE